MYLFLKNLLKSGGSRTALVKKNIVWTFLIKGLSLLVTLALVPVTLNYLDEERFGIWVTLTSVLAWVSVFDLGLGNGLRNKLSASLALKDFVTARKYISTAYGSLGIICIVIFLIFFLFYDHINWASVVNSYRSYADELSTLVLLVFGLFLTRFFLNLIGIVLVSHQLPMYSYMLELLSNCIALTGIYILTISSGGSLVEFGLIAMLSPVVVYLFASLLCYSTKYAHLRPTFHFFKISFVKEIFSLGLQFFIIQIAVLIIFQTSNLIIAQYYGPAQVTSYNITFRYFSVLTMVFGIIMAPMWSSFTDAYTLKDFKWIKGTLNRLNKLFFISCFLVVFMTIFAKPLISIWTQGDVKPSMTLLIVFAFYTLVTIWNNIYSFFLNGISETKIQILTSVFASIVHLPISYCLIQYSDFNAASVVLSMTVSLSFFAIAGPIQTYKLLNKHE